MNNADKTIISNIIKAMTDEEKEFIPKMIPTRYLLQEIERREVVAHSTLKGAWDVLSKANDQMSLEDAQNMIKELRTVLKGA